MSLVVGLDSALDHVRGSVATQQIAGAVAMVARAGEVVQLASVGHQDIEAGLPMQPDTIFRIASMTKPIVSVAALMLVEAGRIDLDDPVARTIPAFARTKVFAEMDAGRLRLEELDRPITVRDLLTHTSGLADDAPAPDLHDAYQLRPYDYDVAELTRRLADRPLAHQPGRRWVYGWSHDVLGRVIEIAADRPLDEFLETSIFGPLGMVDTGFQVGPEKIGRLAVAYDRADGRLRRSGDPEADDAAWLARPILLSGGGGCVSTISDFWRFLRMLERGGELDGARLLAPETVAAMTRNQLPPDLVPIQIEDHVFHGEGYGLGVGVITGPEATAPVGSVGAYTWAGGWGTTFCVDPVTELTGIFLTQYEPWAWFREGAGYWSIVWGSLGD